MAVCQYTNKVMSLRCASVILPLQSFLNNVVVSLKIFWPTLMMRTFQKRNFAASSLGKAMTLWVYMSQGSILPLLILQALMMLTEWSLLKRWHHLTFVSLSPCGTSSSFREQDILSISSVLPCCERTFIFLQGQSKARFSSLAGRVLVVAFTRNIEFFFARHLP